MDLLSSDRWLIGRPAHHFIFHVELRVTDYRLGQRGGHGYEAIERLEALKLLKPTAHVSILIDCTVYPPGKAPLLSKFTNVLAILWPYIELLNQARLNIKVRLERSDHDSDSGSDVTDNNYTIMNLRGGSSISDWIQLLREVSYRSHSNETDADLRLAGELPRFALIELHVS
jgi:hypothetical protein